MKSQEKGEGAELGKIAFIYPGQARWRPGVGMLLVQQLSAVRSALEKASEVVGRDLVGLCFEGTEEQLNTTSEVHTLQVAISVGLTKALQEERVAPDILAGYSLGEYAAFCSSGALRFDDCVDLVEKRAKLLSGKEGGVMALVFASADQVQQVCDQIEGADVSAIITPEMTTITGLKDPVDEAIEVLKSEGFGVKYLPVGVVSHSPLMTGENNILKLHLKKTVLSDIQIPLVSATSNVVVRRFPGPFCRDLFEQLVSPVDWVGAVEKMKAERVDTFVEVGPVSHLTRNIPAIFPGARTFKVTTPESFQEAVSTLLASRAST